MAYQNNRRPYRRPAPVALAPQAPAPFTPSPYQAAFFDFVKSGKGSAVVIAVAGSGKTKSIEQSLLQIPDNAEVLLISFANKIAKELDSRIQRLRAEALYTKSGRTFANFKAKTVHGLGYGALIKKLGGTMTLDKKGEKLESLCRDNLGERDCELYSAFACQLVKYARGEGIGAIAPDTEEAWFRLVYHHNIMLDSEGANEKQGIAIARKLLGWSNDAAAKGWIDFDDMVYLPLLWRLRLWQNDFVFIDEAQDTNPTRRALAKSALKIGGRLFAFGDPNQAIFGFTGANTDSLDLIRRDFNCREFPLSVSYRCSRAVVDLARAIVPQIESAEGAEAGSVAGLAAKDIPATMTARDAILCRNAAPLVSLAYSLLARGTACQILGRDIAAGLVALVKQHSRGGKLTLADMDSRLGAFLEKETAKYQARGEEQKAEALKDRIECVRVIADNLPQPASVAKLIARIESMFIEDDDAGKREVLTLATIHKSKGLEWPQVAVYRPELMPSPYARQQWQQEQEENLRYVCYTRAMQNLYLIEGEFSLPGGQTAQSASKAA